MFFLFFVFVFVLFFLFFSRRKTKMLVEGDYFGTTTRENLDNATLFFCETLSFLRDESFLRLMC